MALIFLSEIPFVIHSLLSIIKNVFFRYALTESVDRKNLDVKNIIKNLFSRPVGVSSFAGKRENQEKMWADTCRLLGIESFGQP